MIWQEGVTTIVCLTNLKEGVKVNYIQFEFIEIKIRFPSYINPLWKT